MSELEAFLKDNYYSSIPEYSYRYDPNILSTRLIATADKNYKYHKITTHTYADPIELMFQNTQKLRQYAQQQKEREEKSSMINHPTGQYAAAEENAYYFSPPLNNDNTLPIGVNPSYQYKSTNHHILNNAKNKLKRGMSLECDWKKLSIMLFVSSILCLIFISYLLAISIGKLNWNLQKNARGIFNYSLYRDYYYYNSRENSADFNLRATTVNASEFIAYNRQILSNGSQNEQLFFEYYLKSEIPTLKLDSYNEILLRPRRLHSFRVNIPDEIYDINNDLKKRRHVKGIQNKLPTNRLHMNITLKDPNSMIGVYIRKNGMPSYIRYDRLEILHNLIDDKEMFTKTLKQRPFINDKGETTLTIFLDDMYNSNLTQLYVAIYNDDPNFDKNVGFIISNIINLKDQNMIKKCPLDCHDKGLCQDGLCHCNQGYFGWDCGNVDYCNPTNCSGNGACALVLPDNDLKVRKCFCLPGFTGPGCEIKIRNIERSSEINSTSNKECIKECRDGKCKSCEKLSCHLMCDKHGMCHNGVCHCDTGWNGKLCSIDGCPNECNKNGICLFDAQNNEIPNSQSSFWKCHCKFGWRGRDCLVKYETMCDDNIDNDMDGLVDCQDSECCRSKNCKNSILCKTGPDPMDVLLSKQTLKPVNTFYSRVKFLLEENSVQIQASIRAFSEKKVSVVKGRIVDSFDQPVIGVRISIDSEIKYGYTLSRMDGEFDYLVNGADVITLSFYKEPFTRKKMTLYIPYNEFFLMKHNVVLEIKDLLNLNKKIDGKCSPSSHVSPVASPYIYTIPSPLTTSINTVDNDKPTLNLNIEPLTGINLLEQSMWQAFPLPKTPVKLVYSSRKSPNYKNAIYIQIFDDHQYIPDNLKFVHIKIDIQGSRHEHTLEPEANLNFIYLWDKKNIYKQTVYGLAKATIYIGYEYDCDRIIWSSFKRTILGQDLPISELFGEAWNLDVHHRFDYYQNILYKGTGQNIYLLREFSAPNVYKNSKRQIYHNNEYKISDAFQKNFLPKNPGYLYLSSPLGNSKDNFAINPTYYNAFLAEGNDIFRLKLYIPSNEDQIDFQNRHHPLYEDNISKTESQMLPKILAKIPILSLNLSSFDSNIINTNSNVNYRMVINPKNGDIYVSLADAYRIIKIKNSFLPSLDSSTIGNKYIDKNWEIIAGDGTPCLDSIMNCGDNIEAKNSKLLKPSSMTLNIAEGILYFMDRNNLRALKLKTGILSTLISNDAQNFKWKNYNNRLHCNESALFKEISFDSIIDIIYNIVEETLYVLNNYDSLYKLDLINKVVFPIIVPSANNRVNIKGTIGEICSNKIDNLSESKLEGRICGITVSNNDGDLHFALTSESQNDDRGGELTVYKMTPSSSEGPVKIVFRKKYSKNIDNRIQMSFNSDNSYLFLTDAQSSSLQAIPIGLLSIITSSPAITYSQTNTNRDFYYSDESTQEIITDKVAYTINDYDKYETYSFDRFGNHLETKDYTSKVLKVKFSYAPKNSILGKLDGLELYQSTNSYKHEYVSLKFVPAGSNGALTTYYNIYNNNKMIKYIDIYFYSSDRNPIKALNMIEGNTRRTTVRCQIDKEAIDSSLISSLHCKEGVDSLGKDIMKAQFSYTELNTKDVGRAKYHKVNSLKMIESVSMNAGGHGFSNNRKTAIKDLNRSYMKQRMKYKTSDDYKINRITYDKFSGYVTSISFSATKGNITKYLINADNLQKLSRVTGYHINIYKATIPFEDDLKKENMKNDVEQTVLLNIYLRDQSATFVNVQNKSQKTYEITHNYSSIYKSLDL
ncbi:unnamed protein product [Gordionus sp. m RMFG-2023]